MNPEFIIQICERDKVWLVCRKSARREHVYRAVAECFSAEVAEILYGEMVKGGKE